MINQQIPTLNSYLKHDQLLLYLTPTRPIVVSTTLQKDRWTERRTVTLVTTKTHEKQTHDIP